MKNSIINRQFRYKNINSWVFILAVNVIVYLSIQLFSNIVYYTSLVPLYVYFKHYYWQFFTYMFTHASFWHLLSNMFALFVFAPVIERKIGTGEFLLFYILVGVLSGVASYFTYWYSGMYYTVLLGASGAIYGLMFLFTMLFPEAVLLIFGLIPIRAPLLILIYFFIDFFGMFSTDGVAHLVHLYGLLFALIYSVIRMRMNPLKKWGLL